MNDSSACHHNKIPEALNRMYGSDGSSLPSILAGCRNPPRRSTRQHLGTGFPAQTGASYGKKGHLAKTSRIISVLLLQSPRDILVFYKI